MRYAFLILVSLVGIAPAMSDKEFRAKEAQLTAVKTRLASTRDSLQNEITARWRVKQRYVRQQETDKDEIASLNERQEKAYTDLSRVREECLVQEKNIGDAQTELAAKLEEAKYTQSTIEDALNKEADLVMESFPTDREDRRGVLEQIRRRYKENGNITAALNAFVNYHSALIRNGAGIRFERKTVVCDDGAVQVLQLARFGNVFGYGLSDRGEYYIVRQGGKLGQERFRIEPVQLLSLKNFLMNSFSKWVSSNSINDKVPTDVMQNEQAGSIIAGKKSSTYTEFIRQVKAGGAVMIPLLMLPFWAIGLILAKLFQLGGKRTRFKKQHRIVATMIGKGDYDSTAAYLLKSGGAMIEIMKCVIDNRANGRANAERIARDRLSEEVPRLNRFLNTIAVIAGAAPLLGLLGTVSGMINLFAAVTNYGTGDPKFLAGGISEALITAKTGLAIAIPALFIHDYLRNKRDRLLAEMEAYTIRLLDAVFPETDRIQ